MAKYTIAFLLYKGFPHGRYNEKHSIAKYNFALRKEKIVDIDYLMRCKKAFPLEGKGDRLRWMRWSGII